MGDEFRRGSGVNACKTLVGSQNVRNATPFIVVPRFELPLLGSNQDSPDPESGVLPITPRGIGEPSLPPIRFGSEGDGGTRGCGSTR